MKALPIVDSHLHFWNPKRFRYEWNVGLPTLDRAFQPADFAAANAGVDVKKMIFVECDCDPSQSLDEVDWICELAREEPRLKGIVARAPVEEGEAVRVDLERLALRPLVKGVRRNLQGEPDAKFCLQPKFVAGVKSLAQFGFTFDLCIRHEQLRSVIELARLVPEVIFVLDHFGKPDVRGKRTEPWAADLKVLAGLRNVVCKISGLTTEADLKNWQPADLRFYFDRGLECFRSDRVMFGGDWPMATLATSYENWIETVQVIFSAASDAEQTKLFQTNAERIYRV